MTIERQASLSESEDNMRIRKLMKTLPIALCASAFLLGAPAYANVPQSAETDIEPAEIIEVTPTPSPMPDVTYEPLPEVSQQPFTIAGNGEVQDDISDGSKEFYTITTSNNNTFYLVVDRARTTQNVYMLSRVDEGDVADFIEGYTAPTPTPAPTVQIQLPTPAPTPQIIAVETEPEKQTPSVNSYMLIGALALAVIGGGWYFKVYKPKHDNYDDDDEGMEYNDSEDERDDD